MSNAMLKNPDILQESNYIDAFNFFMERGKVKATLDYCAHQGLSHDEATNALYESILDSRNHSIVSRALVFGGFGAMSSVVSVPLSLVFLGVTLEHAMFSKKTSQLNEKHKDRIHRRAEKIVQAHYHKRFNAV